MVAIRQINRLQDLEDVDPNSLPDLGVPRYHQGVSSFVVETIGGGGGGDFSAGVSNLGNTLGQTGVTGTQLVLAGGNSITLSQLTDANGGTITISGATTAPQTVQTQDRFNLTLGGNTAGVLALVSSGVLTLAGGNSITLSQAGNAITISGPTTSQSVQTQDMVDLTLSGNTAGVLALMSSGTVTLAGGNNVTLSQNGNAVTISAAAQSVQPETQTFVGGIAASDTTYTSGTVRFTGVGGGVTVSSNTGQRVDISVAAPVAQTGTQFSAGLSNLGNTDGDTGTVAGRLVLAGGNNITLSGSTNGASETITLIGAAGGAGGSFSAGVSNLGNTSGSTGVTGSRLVFAGGQSITLSQSTNTAGATITISGQSQSAESQSHGMSNLGNTSGTTGIASGAQVRFLIAGGNSITLSQSLNGASGTLTISGPNISESIGMSNLGNTSGTTGIASGPQVRFLFAGGNNITLSQSLNGASGTITISAFTQTVQTQNLHNVTLSGNTAGVMAQISSGTMTLAGGNNITLSQNGNAVTISGPNTAAQTNQTLGMYAVQNTTGQSSSTTMDARTLSVAGDGIVSVGYSAGSLRISASQSVQTQSLHSAGVSNIGNSSGDTGVTGTRVVFAGGNNITLSQSTNANGGTITISGANVGGAQTGISGLANSQTTYTSGSVTLSELGAITIRSTTGQHFQLSVDPQSVQTLGMYALGNTTGQSSSTTFDARTVSLRGDGIVSLGYSNGTLRISASQSVQPETQTFIAGLANSQTTYTSGTVSLSELGAITIRSTTGNQFQFSVNAQSVQTQGQMSAGVSTGGNTAGDTGVTGTRLVFVGSNNVTLSQATAAAGGTITISGPTTAAQTNQTLGMYAVQNTTGQSSSTTMDARTLSIAGDGAVSVGYSAGSLRISAPTQTAESQSIGMSNIGNTSGTTGIASGAQVRFLFAGGNNITLSQSLNGASGTITISAFTQTVQTQNLHNVTLSGNTAGVMAHISSGTMTLAGGNNITLSQNGNAVTISGGAGGGYSAGVSNIGNTSGDTGVTGTRMVLAGGNNVTVSQSTNANGNTVTISAFNQSNQTEGWYALGNTTGQSSSTTMDARTISIRGDGIVSVGYSAGSLRISATEVPQTNQTLGMYAVQNTTGQSSSTTMDARTLSVAGDGAVSVGYSAGSLRISAPVQTGTQFSAGLSNIGNTAGDTGTVAGRLVLAGGNNITLSGSTNGVSETITISAGVGGGGFSAGVSNLGNTQGDTGVTGTRLVLQGTDNITLSQSTDANGATVRISGQSPAGGQFSAGVSTMGNTAGATGVSGTRMVLVGSGVMSLSQTTGAAGNTVSVLAPATSVLSGVAPLSTSTAGSTISILGPATSSLVGTSGVSISTNGSTISVMATTGGPGFLESWFPHSVAPHTFGQQGQGTLHVQPMPVPSDIRLDRILLPTVISNATNSSNSITVSQWAGIYTRNASTLSLLTSQSTSTNFSGSGTAGSYSLYGGRRWQSMGLTTTLSAGEYWLAIVSRTTTGGGAGHSISQILMTQQSNATFSGWSGLLGGATNNSMQYEKGLGTYTATTSGIPTNIPFASLTGTGTLVMMMPIYALMSGTV